MASVFEVVYHWISPAATILVIFAVMAGSNQIGAPENRAALYPFGAAGILGIAWLKGRYVNHYPGYRRGVRIVLYILVLVWGYHMPDLLEWLPAEKD